jgi:hypothetical protein
MRPLKIERSNKRVAGRPFWRNRFISVFGMLFFSLQAFSQLSLPINHILTQKIELSLTDQNPDFISCLKPFNEQQLRTFINVDSILAFDAHSRTSWIGRKLWKESFLELDSSSFRLAFDPLVNLSLSEDESSQKKLFINTRGARIQGLLGKNIGFETSFYENQGTFAPFWDGYINHTRVSPGQGRAKRYKKTGWDYAFSSGYIQWQASKVLNIQFGHDKNFIGDGYRSLLLSDIATNYPFLRVSFTWKKVQYTRIIASLMNLDYKILGTDTKAFPKKTANFHLLSFSLPKKIQISLFEGTIVGNPDSEGRFRLNMDILSPVPYMDMLRTNQNHIHPVAGTNIRWQIAKGLAVYNQWVFDHDPSSKSRSYGYQAGVKYYNAFGIDRLFLQTEFNRVLPFTYANSDSTIAYSHYSQPLAHPLGANFSEWVGIIHYQLRHWSAYGKMTQANYGADISTTSYGRDVLRPIPAGTSSVMFQGQVTRLNTFEGALSFTFNPKNQMSISAGVYLQNTDVLPSQNISMVYLAFRTSLTNLYYDFR